MVFIVLLYGGGEEDTDQSNSAHTGDISIFPLSGQVLLLRASQMTLCKNSLLTNKKKVRLG